MGFEGLTPSGWLLLIGLSLDAVFGDPQLRLHPIRLLGDTLRFFEGTLRRMGLTGYAGGCVLLLLLALVWIGLPAFAIHQISLRNPQLGSAVHVLCVYIFFAMRDLIDHVRAVRNTARRGELKATHAAIAMLVGRDTGRMDIVGCRRASIESLSESFVDGFHGGLQDRTIPAVRLVWRPSRRFDELHSGATGLDSSSSLRSSLSGSFASEGLADRFETARHRPGP